MTRALETTSFVLFAGAAAGVIVLHLATNGTLGFHTDELYYIDCGRHLAFGYVDFPPLVPLLARLETGLLGIGPWNLRLLPTLLGVRPTSRVFLYVAVGRTPIDRLGLGTRPPDG